MLKQAYEIGVLLALDEEGFLEKQAAATHGGVKAVAESAWQGIRNYFTGKGVRNALDEFAGARSKAQELLGKGVPIPKPAIIEESLAAEIPKGFESLRKLVEKGQHTGYLDQAKLDVAAEFLAKAKAAVPTPTEKAIIEYALRKKNLTKSLVPYLIPAGIAGGVAATPAVMSGIYPNF